MLKELPGKMSQKVDVRFPIQPFRKAMKEVHVDQKLKLTEGRGFRNAHVSTADSSRGGVAFQMLRVGCVDCVDKRVDNSISEISILQLLAKYISIDEQVDLFSITSSVPCILTAEYAASVYPLEV